MAWYDGLFSSDSGINDQDKAKLANQGLLQAGLGILAMNGRPGTTPFQALAGGLLGGLGSVQQGADDMQNQRYKNAIEQSTLANMQAAQLKAKQEADQKKALHDALARNTDAQGNVDIQGAVREYGKAYPEDAANALTMLHGGKPDLKDTPQGALQIYPDGYNAYLQAGGAPQAAQSVAGTMPASISAPQGAPGGGSAYAPPPPLLAAVQNVESGGNPNAVSPKGARGLLQVTDATAANPGYGIAPSNGTMADRYRVGQQYLGTMLSKYGNIGGLAAYNAGPGSWEQHLQAANGDQNAALASMPAETQAYVPKVLSQAGVSGNPSQGVNPSQLPTGRISLSAPSKTVNADDQKFQRLVSMGYSQDQAAQAAYGVKPAKAQALEDPQSWDDGLSADQQTLVKKLASYDLPMTAISARDSGQRQLLLARASMLNPNFSAGTYNQQQAFLKDLTSNSQTSGGGTINQAKVVFSHINDALEADPNLPDLPLKIGYVTGSAQSLWGKGTGAKAIQQWDTARNFLSGEAAKMVKNGVASEREGEDIKNGLAPYATHDQRIVALNTMKNLLIPRVQALEEKRDQILGDQSPGTSLLDAQSQAIIKRLSQVAGQDAPQFAPPSTELGKRNALMSSPKPNAGWSIQVVSN